MSTLRDRQCNLLREIDIKCQENDIPYILSEFTAYSAVKNHDFYPEIATPTIIMRYQDALRIRKLLCRDDRSFENIFSNRKIDKYVMRYADRNSFFYNAEEMGSFIVKGIGIDIEVVRGVPRRRIINRFIILLEAASVVLAKLECGSSKIFVPLWFAFGGLLRLLLDLIYRSKKLSNTKNLRICRYPHKSVEFSADFLDNRILTVFHGDKFFIPSKIEKYLRVEVDYDWDKKLIKRGNPDFHLAVWDVQHPYEEYDSIVNSRCRINWFKWLLIKAKIRKLRQKLEGYWEILLYTGDRFRLARKYLPQKKKLLALYQQGAHQEIREMLQDVIESTERHMQYGIGLCFDQEILDITLEILKEENGKAFAEQVRKAIPTQYLESLEETGYND